MKDDFIMLCRICLQERATLPIFENADENIFSKMSLCFGDKVKDVPGFPRNICTICHMKLNTACDIIEKFLYTCNILERNAQRVLNVEVDYICDFPKVEMIIDTESTESNSENYEDLKLMPQAGIKMIKIKKGDIDPLMNTDRTIRNKKKNDQLKLFTVTEIKINKTNTVGTIKTERIDANKEQNDIFKLFSQTKMDTSKMKKENIDSTINIDATNSNNKENYPLGLLPQEIKIIKREKGKIGATINTNKTETSNDQNDQQEKKIKILKVKVEKIDATDNSLEQKGAKINVVKKGKLDSNNVLQTKKTCSLIGNDTNKMASFVLEGELGEANDKCSSTMTKKQHLKCTEKPPEEKKVELVLRKKSHLQLCYHCGLTFNDTDKLRKHLNKVKNNPVVQSNRTFKSTGCLKRHRDVQKIICPTCGKELSPRTIQNHIKSMHLGIKRKQFKSRFPCQLCDKDFSTKIQSIIHMRSAHTGERPEVCSVCKKTFFHELYLKEHMRLHTGETPFKCPICNRGYAQRCNMKSHVKHNHTRSQCSEELLKALTPSILKVMKP